MPRCKDGLLQYNLQYHYMTDMNIYNHAHTHVHVHTRARARLGARKCTRKRLFVYDENKRKIYVMYDCL